MRRFLAGMLAATLVFGTGAMSVSAAEVSVYGRHYVDWNQDGICDYCGEENGCNLDICNVKGKYFVDKDKDGICDNCEKGSFVCKNQKSYRKNCQKGVIKYGNRYGEHKAYHHKKW